MDDVAIALLAPIAGFVTALWLLLLWVGDGSSPPDPEDGFDMFSGAADHAAADEFDGPFIPMPDHLTTRNEIVGWMTKELPKLTSGLSSPRT